MMHSLFALIVQYDPYPKFRMEFIGWIHKLNRLGVFVSVEKTFFFLGRKKIIFMNYRTIYGLV